MVNKSLARPQSWEQRKGGKNLNSFCCVPSANVYLLNTFPMQVSVQGKVRHAKEVHPGLLCSSRGEESRAGP